MQTPLMEAIASLIKNKPARFFMPGHKGNPAAMPLFGGVLPFDITEIEGADDLSAPQGAIAESEANMTRAYASGATLYSAFGSSSCILAMLSLFTRPKDTVLMARGCHAAAVRALALLDLNPRWLWPATGVPTAAEVEAALRSGASKTVYLTSPDYYGRLADIPAIAAVCRRHKAALLVDNAHGAHLRFAKTDLHPISLGADAACDSAHKTLGCLTPAALLHLRDAALRPAARKALNLFCSTSPSYLVLQSLDWVAGLLLQGQPDFAAAAARLAQAVADSRHLLLPACKDPLKACLAPACGGWRHAQIETALAEAGIIAEYDDGEHIVLMASPYNLPTDFDRLRAALAPFTPKPARETAAPVIAPPPVMCSVREAFFAETQRLPAAQATGRIAAGITSPCPPGVPLLIPGERVTAQMLPLLAAGGISELDVVK